LIEGVATDRRGYRLNYTAAGLSTIAYDTPIAREILGEAGTFVPLGDTAALATACVTLLEDASERQWRGEALRERAGAAFSRLALVGRLVEVYCDVQSGFAGTR
jgi:glycosyltransferase involved in cell wall biosynthesis